MKTKTSALVSGLGMGMQLLQKLIEEIVLQGGYPEMLHSLCMPSETSAAVVKEIASIIVKSDWRIPRSLMERLSAEFSRSEQNEPTTIHSDSQWWWLPTARNLKVPFEYFSNDRGACELGIPLELRLQLVGKKLTYPMFVTWKEEEHVVVDATSFVSRTGEVIDESDFENAQLGVAPSRYFDFDH